MRLWPHVLPALILAVAALASPAHAADKPARRANAKPKARAKAAEPSGHATPLYVRFDANTNGELEPAELDAIRKAFADGDAEVRKLDGNADGVLITDEILAVPAQTGGVPPAEAAWKKNKRTR